MRIGSLSRNTRFGLGTLGRNTLLGTSGLGVRALIQAGYLLVLTRWLGANGYGLFAGSVALVMLVAPLARWGSAMVLTQYVSRKWRSAQAMWATALFQTFVAGSLLSVLVLSIASWLLPQHVDMGAMGLLVAADLLLLPMAQVATSQCFALEHGRAAACALCLVPAGRLAALGALVLTGAVGTPDHAAFAHFIGSVAGLAVAAAMIRAVSGWPDWRHRLPFREAMRRGTAYAAGEFSGTTYREVEKVVILALLGAAILGPYSAAFRVVSVFGLPVSGLISAVIPRLMAQHGVPGSPHTFRMVLWVALGYGLIASVICAVAAPWVPWVFGPGYADTTRYVWLLAPWPLLFAWHQCMATRLTATDRQRARVLVEAGGLLLVVVLNVLLLPHMGASAAALALLVVEACVALGCWSAAPKRRDDQ